MGAAGPHVGGMCGQPSSPCDLGPSDQDVIRIPAALTGPGILTEQEQGAPTAWGRPAVRSDLTGGDMRLKPTTKASPGAARGLGMGRGGSAQPQPCCLSLA